MNKTFKLVKLLPLQSGTSERGDWRSQDVVIESTEQVQYPDRFLLHLSGNAVDQLASLHEGDVVEALWASNVRTFNRKDGTTAYVQEHRCWKIQPAEDNSPI